jgi:hypothetical protein
MIAYRWTQPAPFPTDRHPSACADSLPCGSYTISAASQTLFLAGNPSADSLRDQYVQTNTILRQEAHHAGLRRDKSPVIATCQETVDRLI